MAEENLYNELSISLEMDIDAVKQFVIARVEELITKQQENHGINNQT